MYRYIDLVHFFPTGCAVQRRLMPRERPPLVVRGVRELDTGTGAIPPTILSTSKPALISSDHNFVSTTSPPPSPPRHSPSQGKEVYDNVALKARALLRHHPLSPIIPPPSFSQCFPRSKKMQACHYYPGSLQRPMYCELSLRAKQRDSLT